MNLTFGSVCSGIEAASVAWHPLGWRASWFAEIEPFPSAVLAHHYPDTPNHGDMTALPELILLGHVSAPDVLCGGTPCQAFSVAGLRKSLDDARGNLSLTFCELANAIDISRAHDNKQPAVIFWENVPGVLNTKDNAFGCFLAGLAGEDDALVAPGGKWPNAGAVFGPQRAVTWRVLDAQYFGVAQRRRRVFVVASARNDFDSAAVLFEFDGVRRDTAPSRQARQETTGCLEVGPSGGGFTELAPTLDCRSKNGPVQNQIGAGVVQVCPTLRAGGNKTGGDRPPGTDVDTADSLVVAFGGNNTAGPIDQATALNANRGCHNPGDFEAGTLLVQHRSEMHPCEFCGYVFDHDKLGRYGCPNCEGEGLATAPVAFQSSQSGVRLSDTHATLDANNGPRRHNGALVPVAFTQNSRSEVRNIGGDGQIVGALAAESGAQQQNYLATAMQVRRLTPVECERLQGFPDGYTAIPWRGKPADQCPDGPRYKALGNSWAVPNVRWIGWRIAAELFGGLA